MKFLVGNFTVTLTVSGFVRSIHVRKPRITDVSRVDENRSEDSGGFFADSGNGDSLAILMYNSAHAVVAELADALA
jgi:hypothetical protein